MRKLISFLLALMLMAAMLVPALAETGLGKAYDAGTALLFDTDNVTLTGTAEFQWFGEPFKRVEAKYIQDGYDSFWQYLLFTPDYVETGNNEEREYVEEKSGFTVIANDATDDHDYSYLYVMEVRDPGYYREGSDNSCNSLVRHFVGLDQIVALAGVVAHQGEALLGQDAVRTETDAEGNEIIHLTLNQDNISDLVNIAFNMCAEAAVHHLIRRADFDFVAQYGTSYTFAGDAIDNSTGLTLKSADVIITLDSEGRLAALKGNVQTDVNYEEDYEDWILDINFDMTAGDYGTSHVDVFDPAKYGVVEKKRTIE